MNKSNFLSLIASASLAAALTLALAAGAGAQSNRIVVPLSHPSQPATLKVSVLSGSIRVSAYSGNQVIIEGAGAHVHRAEPAPTGMHQLDANPGLNAREDDNVVTVSTSIFDGGNLNIQVPDHTALRLTSVNGDHIEVTGVNGDISAEDTNGDIRLVNVSGSIVASALNGRIEARIAHLDPNKPSSFSSMNGTINLTLPADVRADLHLRTAHGSIYLDDGFQFHQTQAPPPEGRRHRDGMYRINVERAITGTLNGGGTQINVQNFNGDIYIHEAH